MRVHIPSALRKWTGGRDVIELPLAIDMRMTAAEVVAALAREHPGIRDRVLDEQGELRRHVNIFIDGENARFLGGLAAPVGPDSEMWIHPSLSGGAPERLRRFPLSIEGLNGKFARVRHIRRGLSLHARSASFAWSQMIAVACDAASRGSPALTAPHADDFSF